MIRCAAVLAFVAACTSSHGGSSAPRGCPADGNLPYDCREVVDIGEACAFPAMGNALAGSCVCNDNGFWICNSCPFYWTPVTGCTPGTTCEINSWEHGCDCGCTNAGVWDCAPQTIGSHCPSATDAGVD